MGKSAKEIAYPSAASDGGATLPGKRVRTEKTIPELDGVRGLAILLVLLVHSNPTPAVPAAVQKMLSIGWCGVDLFFVLSGFLISGILLDTRGAENYFSSFYGRRVLRIFPLYLLSVIAYFHVVLPLAHHFGQLPQDTNVLEPWFWFHLSNWKIAFGNEVLFIGHFWSLAIEEQFYLFWPLVIFIAGRKWFPYVCLSVMVSSFGLRMLYSGHHFAHDFLYVLTPFRLESLAFGSLAAIAVRNQRHLALVKRWLPAIAAAGILLLFGVVVAGGTGEPYYAPMATWGFTSFALISTALVLFAYLRSGSSQWLSSLLRSPVLRSFGKYSYAMYVLHAPIFILETNTIARVSLRLPEDLRFVFWLATLLERIALTFGAALLSWHLVEKHFLRLKRFFTVKYKPVQSSQEG